MLTYECIVLVLVMHMCVLVSHRKSLCVSVLSEIFMCRICQIEGELPKNICFNTRSHLQFYIFKVFFVIPLKFKFLFNNFDINKCFCLWQFFFISFLLDVEIFYLMFIKSEIIIIFRKLLCVRAKSEFILVLDAFQLLTFNCFFNFLLKFFSCSVLPLF